MAGPNTLEFTEANFEQEVLQADVPVLVDFWAEWCMPCKSLVPIIDDLANENAGKVKVGKMDTESNQALAARYEVTAIPTVLLFKDGEVVEKFVGLKGKNIFQSAIDGHVGGGVAGG